MITIAAKCAPEEEILTNIEKADITAVELFTNLNHLNNSKNVKQVCKKFPFRYAVHAPNEGFEINLLAELVNMLEAEIVVFHNIYWEDEWEHIVRVFKGTNATLCVENVISTLEHLRLMRRFGLEFCLDLEHLQMQAAGVYEEGFLTVMSQASHIHMSGYSFGTNNWHTPIHYAPDHCSYLIKLLKKANYSGVIVSEASVSYQTPDEFLKLIQFIREQQV